MGNRKCSKTKRQSSVDNTFAILTLTEHEKDKKPEKAKKARKAGLFGGKKPVV